MSFEVVYIRPEQVRFGRQGDTLSLTVIELGGPQAGVRHHPRVVLRSCFSIAEDGACLLMRDAIDEQEAEIGILEDRTALDEEGRQVVAAELGLYYFVPRMKRVHQVWGELGFHCWT